MPKFNFSGKDILVAESGGYAVAGLRDILRGAGARQIFEARNSAAALSIVRNFPLHAIVVALKIEPVDGVDVLRLVRNIDDDAIRQTPVVMLVSTSRTEEITRAREAGVDEIVAKPICARTLLERLQNVFDNPRPFVMEKGYVGPERRVARTDGKWDYEERRRQRNNSKERVRV